MLIQITNMCHEGCRHCLQASTPNGEHMTFDTFKNAVKFGAFLKIQTFVISGGEPTEHPQLLEFCQWLDKYLGKTNTAFTITSNGTWYPDKKDQIAKLASLRHYAGMQIYTNKQWYKDYDFIMSQRSDFEQMGKMFFDTEPIFMQDLGRARSDEEAQKCVSENPYFMSCLNGHLLARQSPFPKDFGKFAFSSMHSCKPCVDYQGNVHLSESRLCPSFGNVNTDMMLAIFQAMKQSKPCLQCRLGRKFSESTTLSICKAKAVLGIPLVPIEKHVS